MTEGDLDYLYEVGWEKPSFRHGYDDPFEWEGIWSGWHDEYCGGNNSCYACGGIAGVDIGVGFDPCLYCRGTGDCSGCVPGPYTAFTWPS